MLRRAPGEHPALFTDMYHPDAAYVSWLAGRNGVTTFDLYVRQAPFGGTYLLLAGLEAALKFVESFHYLPDELAFLARIRDYDAAFLDALATLRFTGDIAAMPEGAIAFPNEPLLRVTAPFREAMLMESGLLQAINLATLIATKASRIVWAARGRRVSEFAFRRAQNPLVVARSSYIGGCSSTSLLAAAFDYRLLATGTVPHALIQLFPTEQEAFVAVAESFNRYTLLLDTYNTRRAIHTAIEVARRVRERLGHTLAAVRLDSGDIVADSRYVREQLVHAGMGEVRILASGDLDEFVIADLLAQGAEIDAVGVGTSLGTGAGNLDHGVAGGALGGVYKEVWYVEEDGTEHAKVKLAGDKTTWPGRKEVYRARDWSDDVVQLEGEPPPAGYTRLLRPVMRSGHIVPGSLPPLGEVWELAQANLHAIPVQYRALKAEAAYPVRFSDALRQQHDEALALAQQEAAAAPGDGDQSKVSADT
ncbi:MAG: nicotinate phosphoribosyltransferase [Ktedonobacterales bacterium]